VLQHVGGEQIVVLRSCIGPLSDSRITNPAEKQATCQPGTGSERAAAAGSPIPQT
jgi:hypothetical protein